MITPMRPKTTTIFTDNADKTARKVKKKPTISVAISDKTKLSVSILENLVLFQKRLVFPEILVNK